MLGAIQHEQESQPLLTDYLHSSLFFSILAVGEEILILKNCQKHHEEAKTYRKATRQIKRMRRRHGSRLLSPSAMGGKAHHWPRKARQRRGRQHGGERKVDQFYLTTRLLDI